MGISMSNNVFKMGFHRISVDKRIMLAHFGSEYIIMEIFVDDMMLVTNYDRLLIHLKKRMEETIYFKFFGRIKSIIGWG